MNAVLNETDIESLLQRMTLAQKAGQMVQAERRAISPEEVKRWHIGALLSGAGSSPGQNRLEDWIEMNQAYWAASVEQDDSHIGIPTLYAVDAVHGNSNVLGATVFPHNIGLGAAHDAQLLSEVARATAREVLAAGLDWTLAPTLAVAQDCHWGRTYESYSSDPELVCSYSGRFVRGLQGDLGDDGVLACAKHWVGDGGTSHGIDQGDTRMAEEALLRDHVAPYIPALEAGVQSVMVSFSAWNGEKCHGNSYLLNYLLKQRLGFGGVVISEWDGIDYLSGSFSEAIAIGVNAGIDLFMVSEHWRPFIDHLKHHVSRGVISMQRIDDAVRRILRMKSAYGLFRKPGPAHRAHSGSDCFGGAAHRALARRAVQQSQVLLKNQDGVLPLSSTSKVLVAGKNADNTGHQCGGFTIAWQGTSGAEFIEGGTSIWAGIQAAAPQAQLSVDGSAADPALHDVAVVVIGETPYAEGMGDIRPGNDLIVQAGSQINGLLKVLEPYGDTTVLARLHPQDLEVIERIRAQGIPVVTVMVSGRPLVTDAELAASAAFVAAWLPGSEGAGVADVLFGDAPFTGRLPFAWPAAEGGERFPRWFGLQAGPL